MRKHLYMAVDLGTSFIKTGVYTLDGAMLVGWSEPVRDERPAPGIFLQRGAFLYEAVCVCLQKTAQMLGDQASQIKAIAFTGQMAGAMGVDENWGDVTTWSCSLDSRYLPYAEQQRQRIGQAIFEISGTSAPVMSAKYEWFKYAFPEEHKRIAKYVMLNGYIIGRLSRIPVEKAKIDYSLIAWTGLADIRNRSWSEKICGALGIPAALLPEIVDGTEIGGFLHPDVAKELFLPAGIPLVVGAGDKVSGCIGAGILDEGDMIFEAASYGAVSCNVHDVRLHPVNRDYDVIGAVDSNSFYAHKYIQGSGIAIDWFVDTFVREETTDKKEAFNKIEALATGLQPGSERMLAVGLLGGSAIPFDSERHGLFMGHTFAHHKGHFYHALLEGFSYDLALTLESLAGQYPEYAQNSIKLIGGGAASSIWPQMLADVTGRTFERLSREDVALLGATLLAASAVGDVPNLNAVAKSHVQVKTVYTPDETRHAAYAPYIQLYHSFVQQLRPLYQELNRM